MYQHAAASRQACSAPANSLLRQNRSIPAPARQTTLTSFSKCFYPRRALLVRLRRPARTNFLYCYLTPVSRNNVPEIDSIARRPPKYISSIRLPLCAAINFGDTHIPFFELDCCVQESACSDFDCHESCNCLNTISIGA